MCHTHSTRVLRAGDAQAAMAIREKGTYGAGHVNKSGYRILRQDGRHTGEHRLVAEVYLGRLLERHEEVHHRDGVRTSNTIGPCFQSAGCSCSGDVRHNLELWSTSQPAGQRVADKLAYAHELIAMYNQEVDRECEAFIDSLMLQWEGAHMHANGWAAYEPYVGIHNSI